jgi:hypothetical protein
MEFQGYPKMARLSRDMIITEKIDGTNAQIYIAEGCEPHICQSGRVVPFLVGSRTRWIFPENDNFGFAQWAYDHADELLKLGPGRHFGEWWGGKIQRGYGLKEKRFSLFNVEQWNDPLTEPACYDIVPIIYKGVFSETVINLALKDLRVNGSYAAPGFMNPEGIVIWHTAANIGFKKTLVDDEKPKSMPVRA